MNFDAVFLERLQQARWNREDSDPNTALVQWAYGYAEIHGSRVGRECMAQFLENAHTLWADAMRWRWLREQAMSGATPEECDQLADDGLAKK